MILFRRVPNTSPKNDLISIIAHTYSFNFNFNQLLPFSFLFREKISISRGIYFQGRENFDFQKLIISRVLFHAILFMSRILFLFSGVKETFSIPSRHGHRGIKQQRNPGRHNARLLNTDAFSPCGSYNIHLSTRFQQLRFLLLASDLHVRRGKQRIEQTK